MERWIICPQEAPVIERECPKCGQKRPFYSSGNFRINANGKRLDVWLIYKCQLCETTWNMEILSRVSPKSIAPELYRSFLENDGKTAFRYACDVNVLSKNRAVPLWNTTYTLEKLTVPGPENALEIVCQTDFGLRLDKLLSAQWGISRAKVQQMLEQGQIRASGRVLSGKTRVRGIIFIEEVSRSDTDE